MNLGLDFGGTSILMSYKKQMLQGYFLARGHFYICDCKFAHGPTEMDAWSYAKIGLKSLQEYSADKINRQHFQMQVFLAL